MTDLQKASSIELMTGYVFSYLKATGYVFSYLKANGYNKGDNVHDEATIARAGETCQQIIEEFYRRDHLNTLTYDQRMELAMEGDQSYFEYMKPEINEDSWTAAYEAGRQVGLKQGRKEPTEAEAWNKVAAEANRDLDAYLREVMPELPEHYGMPKDGVRMVIRKLQDDILVSCVGPHNLSRKQ